MAGFVRKTLTDPTAKSDVFCLAAHHDILLADDLLPGMRITDPVWATFAHLTMDGEQPSRNIDFDDTADEEALLMQPSHTNGKIPAPPG
ncbi:MAG: hypothetical protein JW966_12040 [Anaerolineae bacterium]|nr:hypothetical protein [Anaerolineae bacterium]